MRPPSADLTDLSCLSNNDVISGISLAGVSDWKNLTTDNSIQIAQLGDLTETSFYKSPEHTNCLKLVDTIESPARAKPEVLVDDLEQQVKDTYFTRTLVTLDSLATTSGRLLDSRLIFSPSYDKISNNNTRRRKGREAGSNRYSTIPGTSTSNTGKLWHSDSELFVPLGEKCKIESKSEECFPNFDQNDNHGELQRDNVQFVKPLATITFKSKVSEIKPVQMLTACQNQIEENGCGFCPENSPVRTTDSSKTAGSRTYGAVTKVYNKLSKTLKRKRKTITKFSHLNEMLFQVKESNVATSHNNGTVSTSSGVEKMARQCLNFGSEGQLRPQVGTSNLKDLNSTDSILKIDSESLNASQDGDLQTGSQIRRPPMMGMLRKTKTSLTIDTLDMDLVCNLKRRLANCNTNLQIKTNGSLRFKASTMNHDKPKFCSPKRSANMRHGVTGFRQTRRCIVSTV